MNFWTPEHKALLSAVRAQAMIPALVQRLSLERMQASDADVRQLQGWAEALRAEPFWPQVAPLIDSPEAWPHAWEAIAHDLSPLNNHHAALFFQRVGVRLLRDGDWGAALWVWQQCADAWARLFATTYPGELFDDINASSAEEAIDRAALLRELLDELPQTMSTQLAEASLAAHPQLEPEPPRRALRFAWTMLRHLENLPRTEDPYGTLARVSGAAKTARLEVASQAVRRFEREVEEFDLSVATRDELLLPIRWIANVCKATSFSEDAVTTVVSTLVEMCWSLRRIGRDGDAMLTAILTEAEPFNHDLYRRLTTFESAFGHNSRCADFIVFQAESMRGEARRDTLERALKVSPGHRNALMLKSYYVLELARRDLNELMLTVVVITAASRSRAQAKLDRVIALVHEAETIFPYNEALDEVRGEIEQVATRLKLSPDAPDSGE